MTDIVGLLDESGSMHIMGSEPIQAMNSFIKEQQSVNIPGSLFSLYTFSTNIRKIYDNVELNSIGYYGDYNPQGMTKLFDCIQQAIMDNKEKNNVVFIIITDGDDTASQNCKKEEAKKLIKEQEEKRNWQVVFLGANQDSFKAGNDLGINTTIMYSQDIEGDLNNVIRQVSAPISAYRTVSASQTVEGHPQTQKLDSHNII